MKKIFVFLGCLFICREATAYSPMADSLYIDDDIISQKEGYLFKCAEHGIKKCQMELGYDYIFRGRLRNDDMNNNFVQAKNWLALSSDYPFSRYLLGYIEFTVSDKDSSKEKYGFSLIQSACYEGVEDACANAARYYNGKYVDNRELGIVTESNEDNIRKAIFYYRKVIALGENNYEYWEKIKNRDNISLKKRDLFNYKIELAKLLIKQKDKEGVSLLESLTYDSVDLGGNPLGSVYEKGEIVPCNLIKAYMYYDLGGNAYQPDKQRVAQKMSEEDINKAQELSWEWQEKHHSYREGYRNATDFPIQSHIIYK